MFSIEFSEKNDIVIATICKDGKPVSPENSVDEKKELRLFASEALKPLSDVVDVMVVSGMPVSFAASAAVFLKNKVKTLCIHNPRLGGAFVVHTTDPERKVGDFIQVE
jgi:hypothetical protein